MRRTTVTITEDVGRLLEELNEATLLRRALEEWLAERGEPVSTLRSEGGRIRVLLQVADVALRDRALEIGYLDMSVQVEVDPAGFHQARDRALERQAPRWIAEEASTGASQ